MSVETVQPVLDRVGAAVPYLRAVLGAPPEDGTWLRCADLAGDADLLAEVVERTGAGRGTDDPVVAASLFAQAYAFRVGGTAAACLAVTGTRPVLDPAGMAVGLARSRPSNVAFLDPSLQPQPSDAPGDEAAWTRFGADLAAHLDPFFTMLRSVTTVGERLLWGNAATSVATALRAVEGALGPEIRSAGERFLATAPPPLRDLGAFVVLDGPAGSGWFWERTNCCLYDRVPGAAPCADCSRLPVEERRRGFLATLETS